MIRGFIINLLTVKILCKTLPKKNAPKFRQELPAGESWMGAGDGCFYVIYDMGERSKKWRIVWQSDYRQTESLLKGLCKKVLKDQN